MVLVGIVIVAVNLRAVVTSLGALLDEVRDGLHLSGALAGVVTTIPTLAFAVFGATTPWLVRRVAPARLLVGAMVVLALGQLLRVLTDAPAAFIGFSALALAGIAVANVLLPMMVKQSFPSRPGLVTGAYTVSMSIGAAAASATAVPVAHAFGSWRAGLGVWALLAAIAVLPWLPAALRRRQRVVRRPGHHPGAKVRPARTRIGWSMAVFFGMQSIAGYATMGWLAQLFRDSGFTPSTAGLLLAGVTLFALPFALLMPALAGRVRRLAPVLLTLTSMSAISYVGLAVAPHAGAVLWVTLLGIGQTVFPVSLVVIGLRARTPEGTVALSAFAQSVGYVLAALGPLLVGILYEATGGWVAPLGVLMVALLVQATAGVLISRPAFVEDEAGAPGANGPIEAVEPTPAAVLAETGPLAEPLREAA
ncbi:MFS transporter, CP family, cyanate transporter [Asanoa hainanensis]|uniref:MFS transporter, CP family, cyanate transporter n=1 Tax=Asanoa hainanensis TaxID=560556 RepID=A0A239MMX3_9ACTN|nr:MFS transporter [Asanoa hainanensis]SNT44086.1 MFS transporter, CP family, cyanate transporter [Asanoa hainanensis]